MLISFIFLEITFGKILLWFIIVSFVVGIIDAVSKNNKNNNSKINLQNKNNKGSTNTEESELSKVLSEVGISTLKQKHPFIQSVEKYDDFYSIEFIFPQDIGNLYKVSLNINFDGDEEERSINTAMVMSRSNLGGVELCYSDNSNHYFTFGTYTVEIGSDYEDFIMMQAETKYFKLDIPTRYRILFQDNSYWDLESEYNDTNDFSPKMHRQLFRINKDYSHKLETVPIKNLFIYQENRTVKFALRKENQIRIQRMMTMHRIAARTYFVEKKKLP